jgi:hypothetical protein
VTTRPSSVLVTRSSAELDVTRLLLIEATSALAYTTFLASCSISFLTSVLSAVLTLSIVSDAERMLSALDVTRLMNSCCVPSRIRRWSSMDDAIWV